MQLWAWWESHLAEKVASIHEASSTCRPAISKIIHRAVRQMMMMVHWRMPYNQIIRSHPVVHNKTNCCYIIPLRKKGTEKQGNKNWFAESCIALCKKPLGSHKVRIHGLLILGHSSKNIMVYFSHGVQQGNKRAGERICPQDRTNLLNVISFQYILFRL